MKRIAFALLFLAMCLVAKAQPDPAPMQAERPRVAVVLSGGGAKGVAHIAALRAIEEAGIPIDIVCGTSMGSLVGALYCIGYTPDFLDSLVRAQDWVTLLSDRTQPLELTLQQRAEQNTYALIRGISSNRPEQGGVIRGRNLDRLFRQLCHAYLDSLSFDSLPIRFACVATDIVTNDEIDFHHGHLITAMRASMAIPGVFTPVRLGNKVLVDGGLRNNYPADLARQMGADIIIGVTVQNDLLQADDIHTAADVLNQIIDLNTLHKYTDNLAQSDLLIQVDVSGYGAGSFTPAAIDTLLRRGAEAADLHRDDLLAIKARIQGATHALSTASSPTLPNIGYQPTASKSTPATSPISTPPSPHLTPTGRITPNPIASVGFRFDSEDLGTLLLNFKAPLPLSLPTGIEATLRLGQRFEAGAKLTFLPRGFTSPTLAYNYRQHSLNIYHNAIRTYNIQYRQHTADFIPLNFRFRNFTFGIGLRWDYFDYYGGILTTTALPYDFTDDHYLSYHLKADFNTEDHWYFPTRGTRLHIAYAYHTDNLIGLNNALGLNDIALHWRFNLSPLARLTFQPMLYGRILPSTYIPLAFSNAIGGQWFGHFIEQQMPFAGIGHLELANPALVALQLQMQIRLLKNHYILACTAAAVQAADIAHLLSSQPFPGLQIGYSYHTPIGPIDFRLGTNGLTRKPAFFLNFGHQF